MIKEKYAFYNYAIRGVEENRKGMYDPEQEDKEKYINPDLLVLKYGLGRGKEFYFRKEDSYKLLQKIVGKNFLEFFAVTKEKFDVLVQENGYLDVLNHYLEGRAVVIVSEFENYLEYFNGGQNKVVGLTGIDLDGEYIAKNKEDLFLNTVSYDDIYNYRADDEYGRE